MQLPMSRRRLPHVDVPTVMDRLRICRDAMVDLSAGSAPRSMRKAVADQMIRNIDEVAWILTGDREAFVAKGHAALGHRDRDPEPR